MRRRARRARSRRSLVGEASESSEPTQPLTPAQRERALAKVRNLRGPGGVRFGFAPMFADVWFAARTPEELDAAVWQKLVAEQVGNPPD